MRTQQRLLLTLICASLAACGGGGGGSNAVPARGNLTVASLEIESPDPTSAHELDLKVGITATKEMANVSVSYYVIHKGDMDADKQEPRQFLIDTHVIDKVTVGTTFHPVNVTIPKDVSPKGDYYLTTRVDPLDQIEETNEDDNVPPEDSTDIVVKVNHDNINTPDFTVESVTLDDKSILMKPFVARTSLASFKDKREHHASLTAVLRTTGAKQYKAVTVQVAVDVPGQGYKPLLIWREDRKTYATTYTADVIPDQPNSVHIDVHVPARLLATLVPMIRAGTRNFDLKVTLNPGKSIAEWENGVGRIARPDDNSIILPIVMIDPATIPKKKCIQYEQDFKKDWHNRYLGVGIRFHGGAYLDGRGAVAEARGSVPVKLFNKRFDFFRGEAYGQLSPHKPADTQFHIDVDVLGLTVYQRASQDPTYTYTDTPFKKVETVESKSVVFVGPVPVVFTAGAQGTIGYKLKFTMDSGNIKLTGTPYAELTAMASAVVELLIVRGGIKGRMTLVRDDYENAVSFGDVQLHNNNTEISAALKMTVTNILSGPSGRLYLFVDYPGVKWCKTFLGRLPCGIRTHHKEKTLVKFRTFQKRDVLLNQTIRSRVLLNCQR